jgi:PAS domain S-box-containing protein
VAVTAFKFLENLPLGICITDATLSVLYVNNRFERWVELSREEMLGQSIYEVFPQLTEDKYRNRLEQVLHGGPAAVFSSQLHPHMFHMPLPDGSLRIQNTTVNLYQDEEGVQRLLIAVQDVTETVRHLQRIKDLRKQALEEVNERERAQAALRESEERYRSIFEHSPLGIIQFDANGDVNSANQQLCNIFGIEKAQILGRNIVDILPSDLLKLAQKSFYGENTHCEGTLYSSAKGGKVFVEANFAPIRSSEKTVDGVVGIIEDVSDRVEAQAELKQSQEMLSSINRNIREGIYRSVPGKGLVYVNESFARMLGAMSPAHLIGETVRSLFADPVLHDTLEHKLSGTGSIVNEEALFKRRDGTVFWVLMSVVATYGVSGEILWYDGAITDITDRRADNERLKESEEQYRNLFQNSRAGMYRCDLKTGKIIKANTQTLRIFGYDEGDEMYAHYIFKHPRDWKKILTDLVKQEEFDNFEFEVVRKDGSLIWISISAKLYRDEGYFEGVVLDITQRKWAEKVQAMIYTVADKTSSNIPFKQYIREIYDIMDSVVPEPNMIVVHENESRDGYEYDFISDKYLDSEHPAWKEYSWIKYVMDKPDVVLLQRAQIERLQKENILKPTHNPIFSWLASPLKSRNRNIGIIGLASYDPAVAFSQREKEILTFVAHHIGTAMERHRNEEKMIRALEVAQQASNTKSQFLANVSHELRTPLNSIIGYSRRLLKQRENLTDAQAQAMDVISRNAGNLLNMINDVLDLSRVEAGKMTYSIQHVDLGALLQQVADELEPLASQKGIVLVSKTQSVQLVAADPARLRQVLVNIVGNAIKFTDHGSVTLSILLKKDTDPDFLCVEVRDTGLGIPPEKIRSIFNVFEQADPNRDAARGGSGLGLAIAARLMDDMKGRITVTSKLGEGSVFEIYIPAAQNIEKQQHPNV